MALYSRMALNVQIISEETIKPSAPLAPDRLKTHKLSRMDQTSPPRYMPFLLSYPDSQLPSSYQNGAVVVEKLKSSLSKTLSHYYPFAGRYGDDDRLSIDCNDKGVPFVLAHVADHDEDAPKRGGFDEDELLQLFPCHPEDPWVDDNGEQVLLAVRVNFFKSTGISIGICIWHGVGDGSSLVCFVQSWAAICRGDQKVQELLKGTAVLDYASMFPPLRSLNPGSLSKYFDTTSSSSVRSTTRDRVVVKRFVVPGPEIKALRAQITRKTGKRPSRVLAVSSLVWAAAIRVSREKRKAAAAAPSHEECYSAAATIVNLRQKTRPMLPAFCMGNLYQRTPIAKWPMMNEGEEGERVAMLGDLAGRLEESMREVNQDLLRKLNENDGEGYMEFMESWWEEYEKEDFLVITSLCGFGGRAGGDFGFGSPGSIHGFTRSDKTVVLMDDEDGQGIEVWATLDKDDMVVFEKDPAWSYST